MAKKIAAGSNHFFNYMQQIFTLLAMDRKEE